MPKSKKPEVFEHLFYWKYDTDGNKWPRWDEQAQTIPEERRLVLSHEVLKAIKATKVTLGDNQAANFAKDFLRKKSRSTNWPKSLADRRWTMRQQTGKDPATGLARNFIFKPYPEGENDPFPDEWPIPKQYECSPIQSVTLSVASKQIARLDEARLMQIAVDLRIVESHFALHSPLSTNEYKIVHMDHLQMGLKLRGSEIDGLYLAQFQDDVGALHPVLITVEAKTHDEFITSSQVIAQVEHASGLGVTAERIVPIAIKHGVGGMFVFEYEPFELVNAGAFEADSLDINALRRVKIVFYEAIPEISGLITGVKRPKTPKKQNGQLLLVESQPAAEFMDEDEDNEDD